MIVEYIMHRGVPTYKKNLDFSSLKMIRDDIVYQTDYYKPFTYVDPTMDSRHGISLVLDIG